MRPESGVSVVKTSQLLEENKQNSQTSVVVYIHVCKRQENLYGIWLSMVLV